MKVVTHLDPVVLEAELLARVDAAHPRQAPGATRVLTPTARLAEHLQRKLSGLRPAWLGLDVLNLRRVALEIAERYRSAAIHVASDALTASLLDGILDRLDDNRWARFVRQRPGALGRLRETLEDLREAGVTPQELNEHADTTPRDGALAEIYAAYHAALESAVESGWTDEAGLVSLATAHAASYAEDLGAVFVHGAYELTGANLELIRALDRGTEVTLLLPARFGKPVSDFAERFARSHLLQGGATHESADCAAAPRPAEEAGQLAFEFSPPDEPTTGHTEGWRPVLEALYDEESRPRPSGLPLELRHTQGPAAEVRIAAREALGAMARGCPPHEIAIVARSLEPFAPAIEEVFEGEGLPWVTSLAQPLRREPLVRDFLLLVRVVDEGFPRRATAELAASPRLDWTGLLGPGERAPRGDLADPWSREAKIIGGLDEWTDDLRAWACEPRGLAGRTEQEREVLRERVRRRAREVERLGTAIRAIGEALPASARHWRAHAERLRVLLDRVFERADSSAPARDRLHALLDEMERLESLLGDSRPVDFHEMRRWLESGVDGCGLPFRAGDSDGVRVLDAMQLRGLTFRHVHLLGLNSGVFPRPPREDPIFPDASRRALAELTNRPLVIKGEAASEERLLLAMVLGSASESLAVSWQRADEAGKAKTPSLALREIARLHLGRPDVQRIRERARHLPSHPQQWLQSLTEKPGLVTPDEEMLLAALEGHAAEHAEALSSRFPPLAAGLEMLRATQAFERVDGSYDGRVGPPAVAVARSVSAWESLGRCPLSFFFRHVLRVREVATEASPFEMDDRDRGSRIHELLELVYDTLRREGVFDRGDVEVLVQRGLELLERKRSMLLGPVGQRACRRLPLLWSNDIELWLGALRDFLSTDLRRIGESGWLPLDFEEFRRQSIDVAGHAVEVSARFDRRLRGTVGDVIGDYKVSANLKRRADRTLMLKGQTLQAPLYHLLGGEGSVVELLGIHPALVDEQRRKRFDGFHDTELSASFRDTLRTLVELESSGVFPFRKDNHCKWCCFASGCRRLHPPSIEREKSMPATPRRSVACCASPRGMLMASEPRLPDAERRHRAATDFVTNFVVVAGAGTGKTSLLVERALNAVGSGVAELRQIAAITFTEKAAGEMRERLAQGFDRLRALARGEIRPRNRHESDRAWKHLCSVGADADEVARRALKAMDQLDGGTVATIHRFCAELLRTYPVEAGVDPGFTVDAGEWADSLQRATWESFVSRELGPSASREQSWRRVLRRVSLNDLEDVARGVSGFEVPDDLLRPPWSSIEAGAGLARRADELGREIGESLERQIGLSPRPRSYLEAARTALAAFAAEGPTALPTALREHPKLASDIDGGAAPQANKKLVGVAPEVINDLCRRSLSLLRGLVRIDDGLFRSIMGVLEPYVAQFRESYLAQGFVGFDGLLALSRNLLRDHPDVRRRLKQRYRLLLVDEFQDTDPLQYEIVLFLAERSAGRAESAYDAELEPGRLFVVGDPKQSIYRFRGADYSAYRFAMDRILDQGGARLDLVANFRSVAGVTGPVNTLFEAEDGCWRPSDYQSAYVPLEAVRDAKGAGPSVGVWTVRLPSKTRAQQGREAEGRVIAEAIERWVDQDGRYEYKQLTLLFRACTNLSLYLRPLRERGIPFVVDGGREFMERPEVTQLMATFRALARPSDQPALLAFLRSPAGGVSDVELLRYAEQGFRWSWKTTTDATRCPQIARCFALLRGLDDETRNLPADTAVRRIVERTRMLPLGAAAFEGAQRVANLQKLAAAAGELARDGRLSLAEVVDALEQGRLEQVKTDRPLADDAADAVRITSIHRMKGLENDVVIVPDLSRQDLGGRRDDESVRLTTLADGGQRLALRLVDCQSSARTWHELEDAQHCGAEEVRVLYVAMTRAREKLVLLVRENASRSPWVRALGAWGYDTEELPADGAALADGGVVHRIKEVPGRRRVRAVHSSREATQAAAAYEGALAGAIGDRRAAFAAPSGLHEERDVALDSTGGRLSRDMAKAAGLVAHKLLESWSGRHVGELRQRLRAVVSATALETGVDSNQLECEANEIVEGFLTGELARLFPTLDKLGREIPLLLRGEHGQTYRGSIDLLYRDERGDLVVADYKTDAEMDEDELIRRHSAQLGIYAHAVRQALELPRLPRTELWLLRTGARIVVAC